jgi:hypothetical protein
MKKFFLVSLCLVLSVSLAVSAFAKSAEDSKNQSPRYDFKGSSISLDQDLGTLNSAAAQGTTGLANYSFDASPTCIPEGWTTGDITAQSGDYFHVDDFGGLGGGTYGYLVPLVYASSIHFNSPSSVTTM